MFRAGQASRINHVPIFLPKDKRPLVTTLGLFRSEHLDQEAARFPQFSVPPLSQGFLSPPGAFLGAVGGVFQSRQSGFDKT